MADNEWKPGERRSGGGEYLPLTVGEMRAAIVDLDDDVEIDFGCSLQGNALLFYRWKWRGDKLLQIELSEDAVEGGDIVPFPFLSDEGADDEGQVN